MNDPDIDMRLRLYLAKITGSVERLFGFGQDGTVFFTYDKTAVKVFCRSDAFNRECECYRRLMYAGATKICGFSIPELIRLDEELLVIEMTAVKPPCFLDFGKAHLDQRPDFSPEMMEEWQQEQETRWGDHWTAIKLVLANLRGLGIYYYDTKPGNIKIPGYEPPL